MVRKLSIILALLFCAIERAAAQEPNIVLILTDDQRWDTVQYMPHTIELLANSGTIFTNAFSSTPLCCPARATILTGLYSHNHGVINNSGVNGGACRFRDQGQDSSTLATWLRDAGYRTAFIGKYLNDYDCMAPAVPPGWDDWQVFIDPPGYFDYTLSENGVPVAYGGEIEDYSTDVLAQKSVEFILTTLPITPFLLVLSPYAPHWPYTPAPGDENLFSDIAPWRPPSYNEADVTDKPKWLRNLPLLSPGQQAAGDRGRKNQLRSLQAVDRAVAQLVQILQLTGRLGNTYFFFTSDNGFSWGEHRWSHNKVCVYEECVRVPLIVRGPGVGVRQEGRMASSVDLAPTIAALAGVVPPRRVNGRSLLPLLLNPGSSWDNGGILLEMRGGAETSRLYSAVHTGQFLYAEYDRTGERELYNLANDRYQLKNVVNNPSYASLVSALKLRLEKLKKQ